ncbi:MAG: hypothetical protein ING44_01635 [Telmatospirillum sp.]|nr:hypothetical protein [Telmatospirillum sp.]
MFPAGSIEEYANTYRRDGKIVHRGLWSILVAASPRQSVDFAERYVDIFNNVVRETWHLAVYAKSEWRPEGKVLWTESHFLHQHIERVRTVMKEVGINLPDLCAVFFDPTSAQFGRQSVVIPFDGKKIADHKHYIKRFEVTHECILRATSGLGIDPYLPINSNDTDRVLQQFRLELNKHKVKSIVEKIGSRMVDAAFGVVAGHL